MKRKLLPLIFGISLFLTGAALYLLNSPRRIQLRVDGVTEQVRSRRITVAAVLKEAGISWDETDRIFPRLNYWMTEDVILRVDHQVQARVSRPEGDQVFESTENLAGNILLAGGVKLFPGERILLNGIEIAPDAIVPKTAAAAFSIRTMNSYRLVDDFDGSVQTIYTNARTVGEALQELSEPLSAEAVVIPAGETAFADGMTIEITKPRALRIVADGKEIPVMSTGATVGQALARAGIPLQDGDFSLPAEAQPLPEDGLITVVRVREALSVAAVPLNYETQWTADDSKPLDTLDVQAEGRKGLKGTFTRVRYENGIAGEPVSSPERTLAEPVSARMTYGTQISVRTITTEDGTFEYWRAIPVYATSYSPCRSGTGTCINGTSSGAKVERGVVGTSYTWYLLLGGQSVYIPGYGTAVVGDVGRSPTNDNRWVDLAYSDADFVSWSEQTTLYFLTPVPADVQWVLP